MIPFIIEPAVLPRVARLLREGADLSLFNLARERLRNGHPLGRAFNDHALAGKLEGLRSAVVGSTDQGRSIVMLYQSRNRAIVVAMIDEHDAAYAAARAGKKRR